MNNILNVYKIEELPKRIYKGKKCIDWNNCIELFGIKLDEKRISDCCRKVINKYKGFTFLFI